MASQELYDKRDLLRTLLDSADDAIFIKDTGHRFLLNNPAHQRLLGAESQDELLGKTNADVWGEERATPHHTDDRRVLDHGESILGREEAIRLPTGEERWISTTKVPLRDSGGSVEGLVAISRDITGRRLAEERLETVVESAPLVLFALNSEGIFTLAKGRALIGLGLEPDEAVGRSIFELYRDEPGILEAARRGLAAEEFAETIQARGRVFDVHYSPKRDEAGELSGTIGVAVDVTERAALEAELSRRNFYDPLTNLPNRALLLRCLASALAEPVENAGPAVGRTRLGRTVALLSVDLGDFGVVSGSLGDPEVEPGGTTEALLRDVAERLCGCTCPEDLVARTGDDEFTVLLGDDGGSARTSLAAARSAAERALEALAQPFPLLNNDREIRDAYLHASVGIALGRAGEKEPAALLAEVEAAVYRAKREGKGRLALYEQGETDLIRRRVELEGELVRAAHHPEKEFFLLYQPYVDLRSRSIVGAEALVRWEHPQRGMVMPGEFISLAEETGAIVGIGDWILKEAARQAARWRKVSETFMVGVNVSGRQLSEPGFPDLVRRTLSEAKLRPEGLGLEITEGILADDVNEEEKKSQTIPVLRQVQAAGVSLAIDDFGTGYSSLARLGRLPVNFLKADRAFVSGLGDDLAAEAIVRATVGLSRSLGVRVVAEGIETEEQLRVLREAGCEFGQGHLFYRPMSADALEALIPR